MTYLDIETLDDSPLHLRFAEKKSKMSPTRLAVISKLLTAIPEEEETPATNLLEGVRFVTYSDRAVAIIGNTFPIKEQIKEAGGNWNKFLTIDGKKQGGWILPTKKANELREKLSGGKSDSATSEQIEEIAKAESQLEKMKQEYRFLMGNKKGSWGKTTSADSNRLQKIDELTAKIELMKSKIPTLEQTKKTKAKTSTPTTGTPPKREKASDSEYMRWKPEPLFDKNKKEVQSLVLMPRAIEELIAEMTTDVEKYKKAIADLDVVPKDWQGTKKEYVQSMKETRDNLAYFRDERSKNITALKNRKLDDVYLKRELEDKVSEILDNESNGELTDKQIEQFIKENEAISFSKVDKSLDYYPTPVDVVKKMIDKADLQCGQKILEPSAGKGNIADAIVQKIGNCAELHVIEYSDHNRMLLEAKKFNVVGTDFLEFGVKERNERGLPKFVEGVLYDRIVMNPPYNNGADFVHISHAYKLLADDGILVALVPADSYLGLGREATQKRTFIEANEGTITVIKAADYNKNLEFTQLTIDVAIITMRRRNVEIYTSNMQTTNNEEFGNYMDLPKVGNTPLPKLDPNKKDTSFVKPETVMAREEFVNKNIPDYVAKIKTEKPLGLFDYQRFGVNKAIHGLLNHSGFLLADGTGTGKTIQMLMTALYFYQTTKKPVAIFTIDKRVLTTSFMKDGKKMRFPVPDYVEESEKAEVERPENYRGLYDRIEDKFDKNNIVSDKNFPPIYEGNEKTLELRDGINIFTYTALSHLEVRDKNIEQRVKILKEQVKTNQSFWKDVSSAGASNIYKNKNQDVMKEIFTKWGHVYQSLDEGEKKEIAEKRQYNIHVWYNKIMEHCETNDYQKDYGYFKSKLKVSTPAPKIAEAEAQLIEATDAYKGSIREVLSPIIYNTSVVIFDEAHSVKNLLLNLEKQAGRAFYANMITEEASKVMFATATPTDRPYDILYLKRAGLFDGDESDFRRIMAHVGVFYNDPKYNDDGKLIRRGRWVMSKDAKDLSTANYYLSNVFDYITRKGTMLRREIQYTNVDVNLIDVVVPHSIRAELDAITEDCTKIDNDGKARVQRLAELQRHQQAVEEYKLDEVIALTDKEIAEGRSVVIFTSMVDTGEEERTDGTLKLGSIRILKNRLSLRYGEDTVGVLATTTSEYDKYKRLKNIDDFLSNDKRILIATIKSGGTGVSLDDQLGYAPRTIIVVTPPLSFINVIQGIGRVVRANTLSRSRVYFLYAKTDHPDKRESYIPVEVWLKRLIGNKFKTLQAAVKGEVKVLDPAKVTQVEAGGENAVVDAFESDLITSPNKHSLYSKTNATFNGWEMPTPSSISIQRIGNIHSHTVYVKARTKEELETWAQANETFIKKYGLELNIDNNFRRYNGSHYGKVFTHKDPKNWQESYELWNALLNIIKPEETKYLVKQEKAFSKGEKVIATTDILFVGVKKGTEGTVENIITTSMGNNADGDITHYQYDVVWKNGKTSISLESWQLSKIEAKNLGEAIKPKYKVGDFWLESYSSSFTKEDFNSLQKDIAKGSTTKQDDNEFRFFIITKVEQQEQDIPPLYSIVRTNYFSYENAVSILSNKQKLKFDKEDVETFEDSLEKAPSIPNEDFIAKGKINLDTEKITELKYLEENNRKVLNDGIIEKYLYPIPLEYLQLTNRPELVSEHKKQEYIKNKILQIEKNNKSRFSVLYSLGYILYCAKTIEALTKLKFVSFKKRNLLPFLSEHQIGNVKEHNYVLIFKPLKTFNIGDSFSFDTVYIELDGYDELVVYFFLNDSNITKDNNNNNKYVRLWQGLRQVKEFFEMQWYLYMFSLRELNQPIHSSSSSKKQPETLHVKAKVRRYEGGWELGIIDGEEDTPDGKNAVCKDGDYFVPIINIKTGQILNWEQGKTAHISYKITDECYWELRDSNNVVISSNEDYVPNTLSPAEEGWGDYMIMNIDKNGFIDKWKFNKKDFKPRK